MDEYGCESLRWGGGGGGEQSVNSVSYETVQKITTKNKYSTLGDRRKEDYRWVQRESCGCTDGEKYI